MCRIGAFDCSVTSWGDVAAIAAILGGFGIILALFQLRHQSAVARSTFENLFVQQYHQLVQELPIRALLGDALSQDERAGALGAFYHYVDLCNAQAHHHAQGRISRVTWTEWREGIAWNLTRPELALVWAYFASRTPDGFSDLRRIAPPKPAGEDNPYKALER